MVFGKVAVAPGESHRMLAGDLEDPALAIEADPPHTQPRNCESSDGIGKASR
jgi:hypothetical protein